MRAVRITITTVFFSMAAVSAFGQGSAYAVRIDNDIFNFFNQTDRFYTNGIFAEVYDPCFAKSPFSKLLISDANRSNFITGISIGQDIYTPSSTRSNQLLFGDRPYASTLLLAQTQLAYNDQRHYRIQSSFGIGIIGKYSGGQFFQNFVHSLTVNSENALGWQHQISNDLLIDYKIGLEKGLVNSNIFQLNATGNLELGTLRDQAGLGLSVYAGYFEDFFASPFSLSGTKPFVFKFFDEFSTQFLAYDATLQGGVFNRGSAYCVSFKDVNQWRLNNTIGLEFAIRGFSARVGRTWQSPEFIGMPHHAWGYFQFRWIIK